MPGIQSLFQSLTSGLREVTAQQNLGALTDKVKTGWMAQSPATKGMIAGGLVGLLLTGNTRRFAGNIVEVGAAALIGRYVAEALAKAQAPGAAPTTPPEDMNHRLLQAMVAAAKADDVVTAEERAALEAHLADLGLGSEAEALIREELSAPLDAAGVAALARSPEEAAALYTASLLVIDQRGQAEHSYLEALAQSLGLDPALRRHLEANLPAAA